MTRCRRYTHSTGFLTASTSTTGAACRTRKVLLVLRQVAVLTPEIAGGHEAQAATTTPSSQGVRGRRRHGQMPSQSPNLAFTETGRTGGMPRCP
jgi:hypothetical protein